MGQSIGKEVEESPAAEFRLVGVSSGRRAGDGRRWWPLASGLEGAGKAVPAPSRTLGALSLELRNQGGQVLCPSCLNNKQPSVIRRYSSGKQVLTWERIHSGVQRQNPT